MSVTRVALIGLGEVGRVLAEELPGHDVDSLTAWDVAFADPSSRASGNAKELGLAPAENVAAAIGGADVIISAVTAANAVDAAANCASALSGNPFFVDLNSASPASKRRAAQLIEPAGGRYVDCAVMAPIEPRRLAVPLLLGGPHASAAVRAVNAIGFADAVAYADTVGPAAATKLCRSIVVKGAEALVTEAMLAAQAWGVEQHVLGTLHNLLPADDWPELARYLISRSVQHGLRRAEELREAAAMVGDTGTEPVMSNAIAERQHLSAQASDAARESTLSELIDHLRG